MESAETLSKHVLFDLFDFIADESEKFAVPRQQLRFQGVFKTAAHKPRPSPFQFLVGQKLRLYFSEYFSESCIFAFPRRQLRFKAAARERRPSPCQFLVARPQF